MLLEGAWPDVLCGENGPAILDYMRWTQLVVFDALGGSYLDQHTGNGTIFGDYMVTSRFQSAYVGEAI